MTVEAMTTVILKHSDVILSAIHHFVRTTNFKACTPLVGSSTKHMFTYRLPWKMKMEAAKVGGVTQNMNVGYACFQEKYYTWFLWGMASLPDSKSWRLCLAKKLLPSRWKVYCTAASLSCTCPTKVGRLIDIWKPSIGYVLLQQLYMKGCWNSHAEHMQLATAAISTLFRT